MASSTADEMHVYIVWMTKSLEEVMPAFSPTVEQANKLIYAMDGLYQELDKLGELVSHAARGPRPFSEDTVGTAHL